MQQFYIICDKGEDYASTAPVLLREDGKFYRGNIYKKMAMATPLNKEQAERLKNEVKGSKWSVYPITAEDLD